MKLTIISLFAILIADSFAEPLKRLSNEELLHEYSSKSSSYLQRALQLCDAEDGGLASLIKTLKPLGFGQNPPSPPWHRELTEEEKAKMSAKDIEAQKEYLAEARERVSRMGEDDVKYLKKVDLNGDLKITKEETEKAITERVTFLIKDQLKVDKDGDKKLSLEEYCLSIPSKGDIGDDGADWHQRGHFEREDKNKDGFIDQAEMTAYHASSYTWKGAMILLNVALAKSDTNNDGQISKEEYYATFTEGSNEKSTPKGKAFPLLTEQLWADLYWQKVEALAARLKPTTR